MYAALASALPAALAGAAAGFLLGWLVRPRGGAPMLLDAVFAQLRSPLALAAVPLPGLLTGEAADLPALFAVTAFTPLFLHTFDGPRGAMPHPPSVLRGAAASSLLVSAVAAGAATAFA